MSKVFRVSGNYRTGHHDQKFSIELVAPDAAKAKEKLLSLVGSKHGVPRRLIKISDAKEVPLDQVENAAIKHEAGLVK